MSDSSAISAAGSVEHGTTTPLLVTSHGRYDISTRLVPSHSGYGAVMRPTIDRPSSSVICVVVACTSPPVAGTDGVAGVFCSE